WAEAGLGWIDANTVRLKPPPSVKVPHIGWSEIIPRTSPLFTNGQRQPRFYFVHSYFMRCNDAADVVATCGSGGEFCCAVSHRNIHGVQFHPEKSHRFGMDLLRRFASGV